MCIDEVEEMIEEMYELANEYGEAAVIAQELETRLEEKYDEIQSIIDEHDLDIDLHRFVHVHDHFFING